MEVTIKENKIKVKVAKTEEEITKGLQGVVNLEENEGMLFVFDTEDMRSFWMDKTKIGLDIVYINEYNKINKIVSREPNGKQKSIHPAKYVLEVNYGYCKRKGIRVGDSVKFSEPLQALKFSMGGVMTLYDEEGNAQMRMYGGERIFSRVSTKQILKLYKQGNIQELGEYVIKEVNAQNKRKPEYVEE
jgi:uncharacterized membrane protein (UPF0127 family)